MSLLSNTAVLQTPLRVRVQAFWAGLKEGLALYMNSASRVRQIEFYQAKSDEELAELGLTRDRIVHHVFRDVMYL